MNKIIAIFLLAILPILSFSQSLVSINPAVADVGQTLDVTLTGVDTHFDQGVQTSLTFNFSGSYQGITPTIVNSITVTSPTTLIANITVPNNTWSGVYYVLYFNTIDGFQNSLFGFQVNGIPAPSFFALSPDTLNAGQTLDVTLNGLNTHFNYGSGTTVTFTPQFNLPNNQSITVNSVNIIDSIQLIANITIPSNIYTGSYNINTHNEYEGYMSMTGLHIDGVPPPPSLVGISNNPLNAGQTLDFTITGYNCHFDQVDSTSIGIYFTNNQFNITPILNSIHIISADAFTVNITMPANSIDGIYDLNVTDSIDGILSFGGIYVYGIQPPALTSVSPNWGNVGQTLDVTILGNNTHFDQGIGTTIDFAFGQDSTTVVVNSFNIIDSNTLTANITIPQNTNNGFYNVSVYDSIDGNLTLSNVFQVINSSNLSGYVVSTNVSQDGVCDGIANLVIVGGVMPFTYSYSNGSQNSDAQNLCQGYYSVTVTDSLGDTLSIPFVIASPNNIFSNSTFQDSTIIDSVYNAAISNCSINYSAIDSVYISNYNITSNGFVNVTWVVAFDNSTEVITDIYSIDSISGVYQLVLQLYCPNKSVGQFLKAYDQIYLNKDFSGVKKIDDEIVSIYPNPFENNLTISLENDHVTEVILTDLSGKMILNQTFNQRLIELDLSELSKGQYFVTIKNDLIYTTKKIIK